MRFTADQYDKAIQALQDAKQQLEPDGQNCACCGDSGHQAFECGFNPLVAMAMCKHIAEASEKLHEHLHWLAGHDFSMGEQVGPAKLRVPRPDKSPDERPA